MKDKKSLIFPLLIIISTVVVCTVGIYWNIVYGLSNNPIISAMMGIHDKVYMGELKGIDATLAVNNLSVYPNKPKTAIKAISASDLDSESGISVLSDTQNTDDIVKQYDFTTVDEDYFSDACFIGDSRTVGISKYSGIENATFLCATSLTIFDYEKPKITYNGQKMSIRDVLEQNQFSKIYIMFGINECGSSTLERFFEQYANTVNDIRLLQPGCIVFVEGSLLVTAQHSAENKSITNENISLRNYYLSLLENKQDIFYIDINDSSLCEDGALIDEYTWDQVHIKAQYYSVWKDFLLEHGVIRD